jgi:hypothetical protein
VLQPVTLNINGEPVSVKTEKGYVTLNREWKSGDVINLNLPMPVRRIVANQDVEADHGRVAIQRGPIVFAAEGVDNADQKVRDLMLPRAQGLKAEFKPELLNGVEVVKGRAVALAYDEAGKVMKKDVGFTAIPYYAWANRGKDQMMVWLPEDEGAAKPSPFPTLAMRSKVSVSHAGSHAQTENVNDGEEPVSSIDPTSYFDWWPEKGKTEWLEYDLPELSTVHSVQVYWFDDTGQGEVRVPAAWRVLYKDGESWKPVGNAGSWGVLKNAYNQVKFQPVKTAALRLEVTMQGEWSAGVQEWKVQ